MWKVLARAWHRFDRDQRGNVAILFAVTAIPLLGLLGGAVDITRHQRHKVELLNAVDSAAIALARSGAATDEDADTFINNQVAGLMAGRGDPRLHVGRFDATAIDGGYRVTVNASMDTIFLPLLGMQTMPINVMAEVMVSGGDYEVALALDNTGSMARRNKIGALRDAANNLVDILYEEDGAADRVKMALVPFTTAVNIRGQAFNPNWLDPEGLGLGTHRFDSYDRAVSRLDIFEALGDGSVGSDGLPTAWKGCVEAREGGYDIDDTAPGSDPVTRWTPYLSPDGSDRRGYPRYARANSYLNDQMPGGGTPLERLRNVDKYFSPIVRASFDESIGPNESCRGPIVELTNDQTRMRNAIAAMEPGGYTHIPQGLMWGWRVLSPEQPFDQGVAYEETTTQKALVLLSDGKNTFPETYTSYGHRAGGRLASSQWMGVQRLNDKVTAICEQVKARGIRLYMILLEENDPATQQIFEDCASENAEGNPLYYEVPDASTLSDVFAEIGGDLTNIHISR